MIIHGDCLEEMKNIPDGSIDCIIADVPYGTTACKWDVVIPFEPMWEQLKRIIKPNGAIVLF
jgi:site-specific DNA-methyltransferase (adenine-specific)